MTTENSTTPTLPVEKLTVKVSSIIEKVITIDQFSPEWSWLQKHPQSEWRRLLEDSVNDTDGQLEVAIEAVEVDVAYREVEIGPCAFLNPPSDHVDPWGPF